MRLEAIVAKIDKFLENMVGRGAPVMRLDPGDPPMLEFPGGHRTAMSTMDILGTVLDGLAKEILPAELETSFLRGDKVSFDYIHGSEHFQILLSRTNLGTRIVAGRGADPSPTSKGIGLGGAWPSRLRNMVSHLISVGGSDLYFNAGEPPIIRLDGHLEALEDGGIPSAKDLEDFIATVASPQNREIFQSGADTEFSLGEPSLLCRMRVGLFHDAAGPAVAIRVIPRDVPDAGTLGLSEAIRRLAQLNQGLVLLTGPMGSGKSTTMACLLNLANQSRKDYIIAVHDSIEFEFPSGSGLLRQREVGRDPQRQRQAIRAALRQAPDILAIGELRDPETIDLALQAAHTGHVVMATLQTTSLVDTFYFLVDSFPLESQARIRNRLAESLKAVVGHTLLRRASGGRAAALETLFKNSTIAELIREAKFEQIPGAMKSGRYGQVSHNEALIQLIQSNKVEPMEAYLKCHDRESFIAACKKVSIDFDPRSTGKKTEV
jgi:twitching motility protein PilT